MDAMEREDHVLNLFELPDLRMAQAQLGIAQWKTEPTIQQTQSLSASGRFLLTLTLKDFKKIDILAGFVE